MTPLFFSVRDFIGSEFCILSEDGARLSEAVSGALSDGNDVIVSFADISSLTTPFIVALVQPWLEQFGSEGLNSRLTFEDISPRQQARIRFISEDIKLRLSDPQAYDRARQYALEAA